MNLNNNTQKPNNIRKIKHFKTESILKSQDFSKVQPLDKNMIKKFNYRLFKLNESNKNTELNNIQHYTCKDLFSNILVKNYVNNSIKNIHVLNSNSNSKNNFLNKNYSRTTNNFKIHKNFAKKGTKLIARHIMQNKYKLKSPEANDIIIKKKLNYKNNNENKIKYGLFPLYYLNKKKVTKLSKKKTLNNNLFYDRQDYYKNNGDNDVLSKTNYTNIKFSIKNNTRNKFNRKIKENSISLPEENDMRPKIRFINLRKDLLEENLKINRMFADFNREIAEKEKILKFIGKHKGRKEDILKIF